MKRFLKYALAAALAFPLAATVAGAQNFNLRPSYGSVTLQAGFMPDPRTRSIRAGGDHYFSGGGGCPGGAWFANAPDYRVHYRAGGYALTFYVRAPGDTADIPLDLELQPCGRQVRVSPLRPVRDGSRAD